MPLTFYNKPGLVAYVTCGDPDIATTREIILAAIEAGADVIELGVPFSDPVADGPVIQRASERALKRETTLPQVLTLAAEVRQHAQSTGLVVFSYLNPVLRMGMEKFCSVARHAGVDGVLLTDLPPEEADDYLRAMTLNDLAPVFLAAPTTPDDRLKRIAEASRGFVYAVARTGVTGARQKLAGKGESGNGRRPVLPKNDELHEDARDLVRRLRLVTRLPIAVGFGISNSEQFAEVGNFADAVVVGSAIVQIIERNPGAEAAAVGNFVKQLSASTRQPAPKTS